MDLDRFTCDVSNRAVTARRLMTQFRVEIVGQLHRRSLHGMPAYPRDERRSKAADHRTFFARIGCSPSPKVYSSPVTVSPSRMNRMRVSVDTLKKKSPLGEANISDRSPFGMSMKRRVLSRV